MPGKDDSVLQTILENCSDPQFNVTCLAEEMGLSVSFLCERAYSRYGMSIHQLLETIRLKQAVKLLASDGCKIELVRRRVGYAYAKTFRRAFKKRLKLTPQEFREKLSDSEDKQFEINQILNTLWNSAVENDL